MNSYLLADDLSGALEAGAAFRARGQRVSLALAGFVADGAAVLPVLSTETRNAAPAEAAAAIRKVLARQRAAGAGLLFKKIDSTLRGPIAAELKALLDELAPPLVVLCPATPAAGRTVVDGRLLVAGVPVAETEFARDPGWPVTESRIEALLSAAGVPSVGRLGLGELRRGEGTHTASPARVLVCDAETDDDLRRLVRIMRAAEPAVVFVGGGGLAHALAAEISGGTTAPSVEFPRPRSTLFVSGSLNPQSRRQLERLSEQCAVPLHEVDGTSARQMDAAEKTGRALAAHGVAALVVRREAGPVQPREPIAWLVATIAMLIHRGTMPELLVTTGGETAQELCAILGIQRLDLVGEFERGVVLTAISPARTQGLRSIIIKPGGFGSADVWVSLVKYFGYNS